MIEQRDEFAQKFPEQKVDLNHRKWGVISAGNAGPVLLLLPGTLGRADIFWQQIGKLAGRARILSVSYPASHNLAEWAEDLAALLDIHNVDRAAVMGSSLGGYLAQYFAALYPDRVESLIAANTLSSVAGISERPPYSADIAKIPIKLLRDGFLASMQARQRPEAEYQALLQMLMAEVKGRIPARYLKARLMALKYAPDLPDLRIDNARIAVIESDDDPLIPPPVRGAVRKKLNPSVVYRFKQGEHFPYVVRPDEYLSILEERLGLEITGPDWGTGKVRKL